LASKCAIFFVLVSMIPLSGCESSNHAITRGRLAGLLSFTPEVNACVDRKWDGPYCEALAESITSIMYEHREDLLELTK
jgi:hypothetical protein